MRSAIDERRDGTKWVRTDGMDWYKRLKGVDILHHFVRHGLIYFHLLDSRKLSLAHIAWARKSIPTYDYSRMGMIPGIVP